MKLRTIAGIISPRWRAPMACESCGNAFVCGVSLAGCWCSEIKVSAEVRAEMRSRFKRCLCRPCLERFASQSRPGERRPD